MLIDSIVIKKKKAANYILDTDQVNKHIEECRQVNYHFFYYTKFEFINFLLFHHYLDPSNPYLVKMADLGLWRNILV